MKTTTTKKIASKLCRLLGEIGGYDDLEVIYTDEHVFVTNPRATHRMRIGLRGSSLDVEFLHQRRWLSTGSYIEPFVWGQIAGTPHTWVGPRDPDAPPIPQSIKPKKATRRQWEVLVTKIIKRQKTLIPNLARDLEVLAKGLPKGTKDIELDGHNFGRYYQFWRERGLGTRFWADPKEAYTAVEQEIHYDEALEIACQRTLIAAWAKSGHLFPGALRHRPEGLRDSTPKLDVIELPRRSRPKKVAVRKAAPAKTSPAKATKRSAKK